MDDALRINRYMKGERLSNRERAAARGGGSESVYRQGWSDVVDWLLTRMVEAEQDAAQVFSRALREEGAAGLVWSKDRQPADLPRPAGGGNGCRSSLLVRDPLV